MKPRPPLYWPALALRIGFGLLLILASLDKIAKPLLFAQAVENYRVIGESLSYWIAIWIPWLELLTGILLISGLWLESAVWINGLLMGLFLILVGQAYARGLDIDCGCFRMEEASKIGLIKLLQNIAFALFGILLIFLQSRLNESKK
jgi:uncharacterized membrane protein YphA (DoxX/SURF4 family)